MRNAAPVQKTPQFGDRHANNPNRDGREYYREWYRRTVEDGRCVVCGELRGEGGTKTFCRAHAERTKERTKERQQRYVAAGLCAQCGEPRGEDGTDRLCRTHAERINERTKERQQRRVEDGGCRVCGEPRGANGTKTFCQAHAKRVNERYRSRLEQGFCPQHKSKTSRLDKCPSCLYERSELSLSNFSFEGLLPRPDSGDRLRTCVWCEGCGRCYHKGSSHSHPQLPADLKLRDEHVGKEGSGMWLLFSQASVQEVPTEYESCSMPGGKCVGVVNRRTALGYLADHRRGEKVPSICSMHSKNRDAYMQINEARIRHQLETTAQPQNGDASVDDRSRGGRPEAFTDAQAFEAINVLAPNVNVSNLARALGCARGTVRNWFTSKGYDSLKALLETGGHRNGLKDGGKN